MELINVKGRGGFLLYFLIFLALTFTDAAIWNDGTHFLYQIVNQGLFVDHLWHRYSDILFQIPTILSLKFFGLNTFAYWVFKSTLYFLPLVALSLVVSKLNHDDPAKRFIKAIFFVVIPFGLMFPISTANLTFTFGTIAMAVALKNKVTIWQVAFFLISHLILYFGHEVGVFIVLVLILHFSTKANEPTSQKFLVFEILFLILFIYTKYELFLANKSYISSLGLTHINLGEYTFVILLIAGFLKLATKSKMANILASIILFYFAQAMIVNGSNDFYANVFKVRLFLVPSVIVIFTIFRFVPSTTISTSFVIHSCLVLLLLSLKVFSIWSSFSLPTESFVGCRVLPVEHMQWHPPKWTIPMLSILEQHTLQPEHIWVAPISPSNKKCMKFGYFLVLAKDHQYHLIGLGLKIQGNKILETIEQTSFPIPYQDHKSELLLPGEGVIKFTYDNQKKQIGKCFNINIKKLSNSSTKLHIDFDGKIQYKDFLVNDLKLSIPIVVPFKEVNISIHTDSHYSMNIKEASVDSCR